MKREIKKIDSTKREISIEVAGEIVKNKFDEVYKEIGKEAKVLGFRAGNIPRDILEKNFSSLAHQQVIQELIPELYNQLLKEENLEVVELPKISDVRLTCDRLSFKATVEVLPQINIKRYKRLRLSYKPITITEDDIKRGLDSLKELRKIEAVDDNLAKSLGYPNLEELKKSLQAQLYIQKVNQQYQDLENEILKQLLKELELKLPQSLVERRLKELIQQVKLDLTLKGLPKERIEEEEKKLPAQLEPQAREQVRVYLVLSEIAKRENIPLDDNMPQKVMEFLFKEADWQVLS
ncbi:MAG: hypothetical protein NC912_02975 [Candidatus Omnitrophica bacterium]|nr:hypothetical protein [Candidatus Omnitrophota bacterium]